MAEKTSTKTILITGGAGFLGSHLCDAYLAKGYFVIAVDNLSTGALQNIKHLQNNSNFLFIKHDICEPLPAAITQKDIAIIANLACPASPPQYQRLAIETLHVGAAGVENLLQLTLQKGARFLQASTSEVYGDPEVHPQPESYKGCVNSYGPRSMYDESKRYSEALIYAYRQKYNINTGIIRIFNTYGPRMDASDGRVVSNFIVQALKQQPLTVYGKGDQTRSFCYVDDLVAGIVAMIESSQEGPVNLGNPGEFTIFELATIVNELVGNKSDIIYKPLPIDDPLQRQPIINKAKTKLGWQPTVSLREGLNPTIKYFSDLLAKNS
jgi:nucleoside-diphosphate-sugar epimerase